MYNRNQSMGKVMPLNRRVSRTGDLRNFGSDPPCSGPNKTGLPAQIRVFFLRRLAQTCKALSQQTQFDFPANRVRFKGSFRPLPIDGDSNR